MAVKLTPNARWDRSSTGIVPPFTFTAWVRPDSLPADFSCIFYAGSVSHNDHVAVFFHQAAQVISVWDDSFTLRAQTDPVDLDVWVFIAVTVDVSGDVALYWRTQPDVVLSSDAGTVNLPISDDFLYLGSNRDAPTFPNTFDGALAYARVFEGVRNASELLTESRRTVAVAPVGANGADWPLDETSGLDVSGNNNHLTLDEGSGSAAVTDSPPGVAAPSPQQTFPVTVELEINGVWTDVSDRVRRHPVTIKRGRDDESSRVQPSSVTVTLQNRDGALSPDNPESVWWPHIRRGMGVRVSVTDGADTYVRFIGDAVALAPAWVRPTHRADDTTIPVMHLSVTAAGVLRRLQQGDKPQPSTIWRQIMSFQDDPRLIAYWPMEDGRDSEGATSPLPGVPRMLVTMNQASDDSLPASKSLPHATAPWGFNVAVPTGSGSWRVEWLLKVTEPPASGTARVMSVSLADATPFTRFDVRISSTQLLLDAWVDNILFGTVTSSIGTFYEAGETGWAFARLGYTQSGSTAQAFCHLIDDQGDQIALANTTSIPSAQVGRVARIQNLSRADLPDGISMGHLWVRVAPVTPTMFTGDAHRAYKGERAGTRFLRLCSENDIAGTLIGDPDLSEPMGPQRPKNLLDLLGEAADADQGILYEQRDVPTLAYRTRESLFNQSPAITLDIAQRGLAPPFEPVSDDQSLLNDITVSRPDGSEHRAVDEESVAAEGIYDDSTEANVETDDQLIDQAGWRLHLGTWPQMRHRRVESNLRAAGPAVRAAWAVADLGDRAQVDNLPRQHTQSVDLLVQGYEETLDFFGWRVNANTSPAEPYDVGVLDNDGAPPNTDLARIDSDGSELGHAIDGTQTGFTVAVLDHGEGHDTIMWTDDPAYLPFNIVVGGEEMTVTAIGTGVHNNPLAGAGDAEDTTPTTSHVAPSVSAPGSTDLLICAACSFVVPGTYTVPGPMTQHAQTVGAFSTLADATQVLAASGATGTRTFTLSASDVWSAVSIVVHGSVVVENDLATVASNPAGGPGPVTLNTGAVEAGWWLLAIQGWDWDPGDVMPAPTADPDLWTLIADSGIASEDTSRVRAWARRLDADASNVPVTFYAEGDQFDNHTRLYVLSGVTGHTQPFTVVRSINGVTKAHAAGTAVTLADPLRLV